RRGRGAAALGVAVERDLAVAAGQVAGGAGAVEHGVRLLGPVHVGVHARGAPADVVGDEHADAGGREDPVVDALEVDQAAGAEGIGLLGDGPDLGGGALVTLADGAAADDDGGPLAGAGPGGGGFDQVAADGDGVPVHVGGGVQHLRDGGGQRVVQLGG